MTYLFALPIAVALFAVATLLDISQQPGHEQLTVITLAATSCIAALLFLPRRPFETAAGLRLLVTDATIITAILVATIIAILGDAIQIFSLFRVASICFLLFVILNSIPSANRQFATIGFIALLATPVWLGPLAETSGNSTWLTNAIVAINPLSLFATALDLDVFRTSWFYEHSALGSLRYTYPSWGVTVVVLAILVCLTLTPRFLINRRRAKL
jgi:hypothetical protein